MNAKDIVQQVTDKWRTAFNSGKASGVAECYTEEGFSAAQERLPYQGERQSNSISRKSCKARRSRSEFRTLNRLAAICASASEISASRALNGR
jgi:ketosteroid isomerase-like protein